MVARASGMSRNTVIDGARQADEGVGPSDRIRQEGGGRPKLIDVDPNLLIDLDDLVEPDSRGDPMSPLRWTLKSTRQLADALVEMGHQISYRSVGPLLHAMGYSLQATAKTVEGAQHPDRNAQFEHINAEAKRFLAAGEPVISIDSKHSKDFRPDLLTELRDVFSLAVTAEGIPIRCWTFPGTTSDQLIIKQIKDDLAGWMLSRVVWVADSGFNSVANRAYLQRCGGHYIVAERVRGGSVEGGQGGPGARRALSQGGREPRSQRGSPGRRRTRPTLLCLPQPTSSRP